MRRGPVAAVVGGVILFVWGFLGHAVLRIYDPAFRGFVDEQSVAEVVVRNAPESGLYYFPIRADYSGPPQAEGLMNFVASGDRSGFGAMSLRGFLIQTLTVLIVLSIIGAPSGTGYWARVGRFTAAGLAMSIGVHGYYWAWFDFPGLYSIITVFDAAIAWTLVGLVLAWSGNPIWRRSDPHGP